MFDSVIFDVDGTIWDSTELVEQAWNRALERKGHSERVTAQRLRGLFGRPMIEIIQNILPDCTPEQHEDFIPLCYELEHDIVAAGQPYVYEGLEEALRQLSARVPLHVVSNCQAGYIELMLEKTGFGRYFQDHLCPGDNGLLKADNIRLIMQRNGLKDPVYLGDTRGDADACAKAGVPFAFASWGFGSVAAPDIFVSSPADLPAALQL